MKLRHCTFERSLGTTSERLVTLNEEVIKGQVRELVRGGAEETLNKLLEAELFAVTDCGYSNLPWRCVRLFQIRKQQIGEMRGITLKIHT